MSNYCYIDYEYDGEEPGMGANEDVALHGLRVSLGSILDSFGFGTASDNSLDTLTDVMSRFINSISTKSKFYTEHAGRSETAATDLNLAFKKINFSTIELVDFAKNNKLIPPQPMPKFPVARQNPRPLFHPQPSEKELETRPEHIPRHYQAAHPEWTRDGADYLAVMKPCTSSDKKGSAPDFPSFDNCTAKSMGISKEDRKPAPPIITRTDDSSATGITSSANIASQKLYNPDYAAQLSKKKNRPLNGLKDSRSSTPIGRSNSPYMDLEDRIRTDSPSTSRSAEKPKFKPRPPSSAARNLFETKPETVGANENYNDSEIQSTSAAAHDGRSSSPPMPKLEEAVSGDQSQDGSTRFEQYGQETPPTIVDESVIKKNIFLFQQLKQQQEQEERIKKEKEKEKAEKQRKKEEMKERKKEAARMKEEQKKELDDQKKIAREEEKRKKKEEKLLSLENKAREEAQAREREMQQKLMETMRSIKDNLAPNIFEEQKPLKLTITNPLSSNASSTFSPSPIRAPPSLREASPPPFRKFHKQISSKITVPPMTNLDDEDTIPYYGGEEAGPTVFSSDISTMETPKKKKKKREKDKERELSPSSHKKHKKDKEHKKKKKRDKEEKEKEKEQKEKDNMFYKEPKAEIEQKLPTLKIRLGDQTPSHSDTSASTYAHEPVKIKFKIGTPDEKVPPLRLGGSLKTPSSSSEKSKHKTPQKVDKEKEEKHRRKEERRKREKEEAEQKQRAEYERIQREHEEKQRKVAEDQKRLEEQVQRLERDREELQKKQEREKKRMERELAHIQATAGLESIFKKKDKDKEREKEKVKEKKPDKEEHKKKEESTRPSAPGPDPLDEEDEKMWICPTCHVAWTEGANMVACDACNNWFHWHCVGLLVAPEDDTPWYCKKCSRKPMKRPIKSSSDQPKKKKKSDGHSYLK